MKTTCKFMLISSLMTVFLPGSGIVLFLEWPMLWSPVARAVPYEQGHTLFLRCFTCVMVWFTNLGRGSQLAGPRDRCSK